MAGRKPKPDREEIEELSVQIDKLEKRIERDTQRCEQLRKERAKRLTHWVLGQMQELQLPFGKTYREIRAYIDSFPEPVYKGAESLPPSSTDETTSESLSTDRYVQMKVRVNEVEKAKIHENMERTHYGNFNTYARKMLLDGYVVNWDYTAIRELTKELGAISRSLNQLAKRANSTNSIYAGDMEDIKREWNKLKLRILCYLSRRMKEDK